MSTAKSILGIVPGLQATALVMHNVKFMKDSMKPSKNPMKPKKMIKLGVTNLLGIGLIKPTAQMINALD